MPISSLFVAAVLCGLVALSEWLVRRTPARHVGSALLVILLTAVVANLGVLPTGSTAEAPVPVYDGIFSVLAPLSILWLLLAVDLRAVLRAGPAVVGMFLVGTAATVVGVLVGMWVVRGPETVGPLFAALGGMFAGTYTGGSLNFNAVAIGYDVMRDGPLFAGAVAVDNIVTTVWIMATLALPRLLLPLWPRPAASDTLSGDDPSPAGPLLGIEDDTETLHPLDLGLALGLGLGALWLSDAIAAALAETGLAVPSILILTVLALVLAQLPVVARLRGPRLLGMFGVYLFLAVVGAYCDVVALRGLGELGLTLLAFTSIAVAVHGAVVFGVARAFRVDLAIAAVTSQANVGGGTSALALARSLGRDDLVLPAVLVGSLGTALGTFVGFWVAGVALPLLLS
ncbi:DUF819 domain-containing protein [Rubrivirga sp. IMCC43871]|uniref:DUF819 family protein n=1 Tax=Rubrivirga sp. IMCC43871 TaxID=3391575 RepID=UPI0039900807